MNLIQTLEQEEVARLGKKVPVFQAGDTLKVNVRIKEGDKARVQAYEVGELARVSPLVEGVPVDFKDTDGSIRSARARLIDFDRPDNNDFLAVNQFTVVGTKERRPDVVLFINGLPVVLMELKRPGDVNATLRGAFNQTHGEWGFGVGGGRRGSGVSVWVHAASAPILTRLWAKTPCGLA